METNSYKIADFIINIELFPSVNTFYRSQFIKNVLSALKGFKVKTRIKYDYKISVTEQLGYATNVKQINNEKKYFVYLYADPDSKSTVTHYSISLHQFMLILINKIQLLLIKHEGFALHSSAVQNNNDLLLFFGPSEAGKSTIVKLLNKNFKIIADDAVIIRKIKDFYYTYQSPYIEKNYSINKTPNKFTSHHYFFLKKSTDCRIKKINNKTEILELLSKQLWTEKNGLKIQMKYLLRFINQSKTSYYYLSFPKNSTLVTNTLKKFYESF